MRKKAPTLSAKIKRLANDCQLARQERHAAQARVQSACPAPSDSSEQRADCGFLQKSEPTATR